MSFLVKAGDYVKVGSLVIRVLDIRTVYVGDFVTEEGHRMNRATFFDTEVKMATPEDIRTYQTKLQEKAEMLLEHAKQ
jgi:hypothetical protein